MSEVTIESVFLLLDVKKAGSIGLEMIFDFTDCFTTPPDHEDVIRILKDFDTDGNGKIDQNEWVELCSRFKDLSGFDEAEMAEAFKRHQYEILFDLADDDGGGTIDKSEFKNLIETLHGMLALKQTAADVSMILKPYEEDELTFAQFYPLLSKMLEGKSIVEVVDAFREARTRRQELKLENTHRFETGTVGKSGPGTDAEPQSNNSTPRLGRTPRRAMTKMCLACTKKEVEIQELRERLAQLEGSFCSPQTPGVAAPLVRKYEVSIEPKIWDAMDSVETAVGCFKDFPQTLRCAIVMARARRVRNAATRAVTGDVEALVTELQETSERCHKTFQGYTGILDNMLGNVRDMNEIKLKFLRQVEDNIQAAPGAPIDSSKFEGLLELSGEFAALKSNVNVLLDNAAWTLDSVVEARTSLCDQAMSGTVFSNKGKKLMETVLAMETATAELSQTSTILMYNGCDNWGQIECLMDEAATGTDFSVTDVQCARLREEVEYVNSRIQGDAVEAMTKRVKSTIFDMQVMATSLVARTRDRGVNTKVIKVEKEVVVKTEGKVPHIQAQKSDWRSPPPRIRKKKLEQQVSMEAFDRVVEQYKEAGVKVPDNFGRLNHMEQDSKRNTYAFGTKRIDLVLVDNTLAVIVGGGFLLFDEFCLKYTNDEVSRLGRFKECPVRNPSLRSGSAGYSVQGDWGDFSDGGGPGSHGTSPAALPSSTPGKTARQDPYSPDFQKGSKMAVVRDGKGVHLAKQKMTPKQRTEGMFS